MYLTGVYDARSRLSKSLNNQQQYQTTEQISGLIVKPEYMAFN